MSKKKTADDGNGCVETLDNDDKLSGGQAQAT